MIAVRRTAIFSSWLSNLRDDRAEARIEVRIGRMEQGNPGDVRSVGEGVSELRIHYGPGYRVYFVDRGREVIILLCGGDKSSQSADIARAKQMSKEV
jgi:putative addiction module killer protein